MKETIIIFYKKGQKLTFCHKSFELWMSHTWNIQKTPIWYASRCVNNKGKIERYYFHRVLLNCPSGMSIDHINGDTLDNRVSNLRICTQQQNNFNRGKAKQDATSKYLGVAISNWYKKRGTGKKWAAFCGKGKRTKHLGVFDTEEEAAIARDKYALKEQGEFARLNFPSLIDSYLA
jgi:hypothetical protein